MRKGGVDSGGGVERPTAVPIWALFAANAISMVGNVLAALAIPWFVLQTTGSAAKTGVTGFFEVLPVVLAGFLGGTIVDRMGYKRTSIVADIASSLAVLLSDFAGLSQADGAWLARLACGSELGVQGRRHAVELGPLQARARVHHDGADRRPSSRLHEERERKGRRPVADQVQDALGAGVGRRRGAGQFGWRG